MTTNFAQSTIAVAPAPATTGLTITVAAGEGVKFAPGEAWVWPPNSTPSAANAEVITVSTVVGDILTLATRAAEGSALQSPTYGWSIAQGVTAQTFDALVAQTTATLAAATAATAAVATKLPITTRTSVKTGAYTAVVGDQVPVDTTAGSVTITLPTAVPDGSVIAVKHVIRGTGTTAFTTNVVTIATAGSDVFNRVGGSTTLTLTVAAQGVLLQYSATAGIWTAIAGDLPYANTVADLATTLAPTFTRSPGVSIAFQGVIATLRRGWRSTCVQLVGDSTGDGFFVGTGAVVDEWPQVFMRKLQTDFPAYTLLQRHWNDSIQSYDLPVTMQAGTGNGVSGTGDRYVSMLASNPTSMYHQGTTPVTGDLDIRMRIAPATWTPSGDQTLAAHYGVTGNNRCFYFSIKTSTGQLCLRWSTDGTSANLGTEKLSTVATGFSAGSTNWVRATLDVDNGATGNTVAFYTSADGVTWTQLGTSVVTAGVTSVFSGGTTTPYQIGAFGEGNSNPYSGKIFWTEIRSGLGNGQSVVAPLPDDWDWNGTETSLSFGGAPVLMFLNGSQSGQNVAYFDDPTRRVIINQPHGQAVLLVSTSHNDQVQSRYIWLANYGNMITNMRTLTPNVPVVFFGQNPPGLGGSFNITQQGIELRESRAAILQQYAASRVGCYAFDPFPALTSADTVDQLHPTSGTGSGSEKWGLYLYNRVVKP